MNLLDILGNADGLKGLLTDEQLQGNRNNALLQAGLATMAASQGGQPGSGRAALFPALMQGLQAGQGAFKSGIESQVGNVLTAQKIREIQRDAELRKLLAANSSIGAPMTMGVTEALADGGGPTNANAAKIGTPNQRAIKSEYDRLMRNAELYQMAGKDDLYIKMLEAAEKLKPKITNLVETVDANGRPVRQGIDAQGNLLGGAFASPVKPENMDIGGEIRRIDPYTGKVLSSTSKTQTFADRTAAGNLSVAQQRLQFDRDQAELPKVNVVGDNVVFTDPRTKTATTATIPGVPPKLTEDQGKSGGFYGRMKSASQFMTALTTDKYGKPIPNINDVVKPSVLSSALGSVPFVGGVLENKSMDEQRQQYVQSQRDWVTANLRAESGAAIGRDEMDNEIRKYFPQIGDSPAVIAQKEQARAQAEEAMRVRAGPAASLVKQLNAPGVVDFNDLPKKR